jgi:hypothetical protein
VDVFAAGYLRRPGLPERLVETLIPAAAVAVAVVEQPRLSLGEHRVRLGELAELLFRIGRVRDVGVRLACEDVVRAPDRLLVGIPGNAEDLVVVPFDDRHSSSILHTSSVAGKPESGLGPA